MTADSTPQRSTQSQPVAIPTAQSATDNTSAVQPPAYQNGTPQNAPPRSRAPQPVIKKMRWPFPMIWIIPIAAICLAGYYFRQQHKQLGVQISVMFDDSSNVKPDETTLAYHGVTIGRVKSVYLSGDHKHASVQIQLVEGADFIAHANTVFWLVRPEISLQTVTGLNTIVSGPYINCQPGEGQPTYIFTGQNGAPVDEGTGLTIIASALQVTSLSVDSPVNYRGVQVGVVKSFKLSESADSVDVTLIIWEKYRALVRSKSKFWMIKGADIHGSLLGGVKVNLGSLQNIISGGVAFNTPEKDYGNFVIDGERFELHDQPEDDWLNWRAKIMLSSDLEAAKPPVKIPDPKTR